MTTQPLAGYSDDDLLNALYETRELRGRIEQEIERRFVDRETIVIDTERYTATQRQDTVKYVFSERKMYDFKESAEAGNEHDIVMGLAADARQISRPYVSLSRKEPTEVAL